MWQCVWFRIHLKKMSWQNSGALTWRIIFIRLATWTHCWHQGLSIYVIKSSLKNAQYWVFCPILGRVKIEKSGLTFISLKFAFWSPISKHMVEIMLPSKYFGMHLTSCKNNYIGSRFPSTTMSAVKFDMSRNGIFGLKLFFGNFTQK